MATIVTFTTGIDMSLFRRRGRHDLYGRTPMRNDADDYDSFFDEEEYEDDDMYNQPSHKFHGPRRSTVIVAAAILIIILLSWLVFLPSSQLNNYPKADGDPVATIQIQKTPALWSEYVVTGTYRDASGHEQHIKVQRVAGDSITVEIDVIQFPGSDPRYLLVGASGQYTSVLQQHAAIPTGTVTTIQFNTGDNGYVGLIKAHPLLAPTVGIVTCNITLGPIANYNSHSFVILITNGTCSKQQLS